MTKLLAASMVLSVYPLHADFETGLRAFQSGAYGDALPLFLAEAEKGNARAENALGFLYERGLGVAKNADLAAGWFRKSAEQGYGPGEYNYGLFCWHGTGVSQSDAEATKWFERAASHGEHLAEFDLGNLIYKEGKGDTGQALVWWRKAAEHNIAAAAYNAAYLYAEGSNAAHDYREAAKWYHLAARQNYPLAQYALGLLYEGGKGVQADFLEAQLWLELAARNGIKQARAKIDSHTMPLSQAQLQYVRQRVAAWKPLQAPPLADEAFVSKAEGVRVGSNAALKAIEDPGPERTDASTRHAATGFFVNSEGGVVTSLEIVSSCKALVVHTAKGERRAEPAGEDRQLGAAVIVIEGGGGNPLVVGQGVVRARAVQVGYQLAGRDAILTSTLGTINEQNQKRDFQPDSDVEPPLHEGPLLNTSGRVVAVSLTRGAGSSLIGGDDLLRFLKSNRVPLGGRPINSDDLPEIAAGAKQGVVLVECKQY